MKMLNPLGLPMVVPVQQFVSPILLKVPEIPGMKRSRSSHYARGSDNLSTSSEHNVIAFTGCCVENKAFFDTIGQVDNGRARQRRELGLDMCSGCGGNVPLSPDIGLEKHLISVNGLTVLNTQEATANSRHISVQAQMVNVDSESHVLPPLIADTDNNYMANSVLNR